MSPTFVGVAIGGTKCSVSLARYQEDPPEWIGREEIQTKGGPDDVLKALIDITERLVADAGCSAPARIGIVCGGPLDEELGLVLSPPNLPGWDRYDVVSPFAKRFSTSARLMNDANAGALAEWAWGATRGTRNCVFLTMGTGMGAGLILNARVHVGVKGLAGEVGHWRLAPDGPLGYDKHGSFEGFCSGGGIALWAIERARVALASGRPTLLAGDEGKLANISARSAAEAALAGDRLAQELWSDVGDRLGAGLALIIDILNPEIIAIGGIFPRQRALLTASMQRVLRREALDASLTDCAVVAAQLGESISDYSALAVALIGETFNATSRRLTAATWDEGTIE